MYLPMEESLAGTSVARGLMRLCDLDHAARRRRLHYQQWCEAVRGLPHCRPLFPKLPADCTLYMFPPPIDAPRQHFFALKKLGMPIWRWDGWRSRTARWRPITASACCICPAIKA